MDDSVGGYSSAASTGLLPSASLQNTSWTLHFCCTQHLRLASEIQFTGEVDGRLYLFYFIQINHRLYETQLEAVCTHKVTLVSDIPVKVSA